MTNPEIAVEDAELAALMDELEAENAKIVAAAPAPEPKPEPKPEPVKVAQPEPEPQPEPVKEPEVMIAPGGGAVPAIPMEDYKPDPVEEKEIDMGAAAADADIQISQDVPKTSAQAKLKFSIDPVQFNKETRLTEATLDTCMIEQSALRAFYGAQAANAEAQHARLKARFDVLEASLYDQARKDLTAAGEKVTEKAVENAVKLNPKWIAGKNTVIEAETIANINKALVASLADRRDMMIQLGADRREEYKGAARVLAEKDAAASLKERASAAFQQRSVQ